MIERKARFHSAGSAKLLGLARRTLLSGGQDRRLRTGTVMALIDRQYLQTPFYGSRWMAAWLQAQGHAVKSQAVQRLMLRMDWRPFTSARAPVGRHQSIGSIRTSCAG